MQQDKVLAYYNIFTSFGTDHELKVLKERYLLKIHCPVIFDFA